MGNKWRACRLGDLFDVNPARPLKRGSVTPFIPMEALPPHARAVERIASREYTGSGMRFRNGDTLIARITPCLENGKTAFISGLQDGEVAHGSTEYIVLAGKDGQSDSLFGYYLARTPEFRRYAIGHMEGTSGRQRVPASAIEKYRIALPPLAEQRAIAQILGTLDDKIELNRRMNQTLENMAQALFQSWFVDFDGVSKKDMQASELGLIPKGWRVEEIGKFVQCVGGATPSTKNESFWNHGKHHWATPKDLSKLQAPILISTERCITDAGLARISSGLLPAGTLLMSSRAPVGYLAIATMPLAINQGFIAMLPEGILSPVWLLFWAKNNMEAIKQRANGSTFMEISKMSFRSIKVAVPLPDKLAQFDTVAKPILARIISNERDIATLATLRDTLLPRLMSGHLRLKNIEKFAGKAP